jgi:hypothetical protein
MIGDSVVSPAAWPSPTTQPHRHIEVRALSHLIPPSTQRGAAQLQVAPARVRRWGRESATDPGNHLIYGVNWKTVPLPFAPPALVVP